MSTKQSAAIKALLLGLFDADDAVAIETVEQLRTKGNETCIEPLLDVLISEPSNKLNLKVVSLLSDLKHEASLEAFVSHIGNKKYTPIAHTILGIAWNNVDMNLTSKLTDIVDWSINTTLYACIEGSTAVESIEAEVAEEDLLESMVMCNKYLTDNPENEKTEFIIAIVNHLKKLEEFNVDI